MKQLSQVNYIARTKPNIIINNKEVYNNQASTKITKQFLDRLEYVTCMCNLQQSEYITHYVQKRLCKHFKYGHFVNPGGFVYFNNS